MKVCSGCKQELDESNFFKRGDGKGVRSLCKRCYRTSRKDYEKKHKRWLRTAAANYRYRTPVKTILWYMRGRAKKLGIVFTITEADISIPDVCPILGIRLACQIGKGQAKGCSPSLDRIDPTQGYIPGNVRVISQRANFIKSNLTPQEITKLYQYVTGGLQG